MKIPRPDYKKLPYRIILYILEFYILDDYEFKTTIKTFYGCFKLDFTGKKFLIFKNFEFTNKGGEEYPKKLRYLGVYLFNESYTGENLRYFTELRHLKIYKNFCNKFNVENLGYLNKLQSLEICECENFTGKFLEHLKKLRYLNVYNCEQFTGECSEYLRELLNLQILFCDQFTGKYLKHLKKLRYLKIENCKQFTGECLKYLKKLRDLKIFCCDQFTGKYIQHLKKLRHLQIEGCSSQFSKEFLELENSDNLEKFLHLKGIKVSWCINDLNIKWSKDV